MNKLHSMLFLVATGALIGMARANLLEPVDIIPQSHIQFDNNGNFIDDTDLVLFLRQAAQEGVIPGDFHGIKKVELLSKELNEAWGSDQLWLIECMSGNSYVLKKIKKGKEFEEINRLEQVRSTQRLKPYVYPNKRDNLQLILPSCYLMYTCSGRQHVVALMPKAQGVRFQSIVEDFERNPDDQNVIKFASKAYYDLGIAMAKFYNSLGTLHETISHRDFHQGNIFYDLNGLVTLIDNEHMAQTLEQAHDISYDLGFLFVRGARAGCLESCEAKKWYEVVLPSFLCGFMGTYEKQERVKTFTTLVELIDHFEEGSSSSSRGIMKEILKRMETQFVDPSTSELGKMTDCDRISCNKA